MSAKDKKIEVKANLKGVSNLIRSFAEMSGLYIKVGILSDKNTRTTGKESNASIGLVHEFGSILRHIPERSFIKMPLEKNSKELVAQAKQYIESDKESLATGDSEAVKALFTKIGNDAEGYSRESFNTRGFGQWPSLAPATIAAKGFDAILIKSGELSRSITSKVVARGSK